MVLLIFIGFIVVGELIFLKLVFSETRIFNQKELEDTLQHEPDETEYMKEWTNQSNLEIKRATKDSNRVMFCMFYIAISAVLFLTFNTDADLIPGFVGACVVYFMYAAFKAASHVGPKISSNQNAPDQFFDGGQ